MSERKTRHKGEGDLRLGRRQQGRRSLQGDLPSDVTVVQPPLPEVIASGHVVPRRDAARDRREVGICGSHRRAAKTDISTADAVTRTLLAAQGINLPKRRGPARLPGGSFNATMQKKVGLSAR